MTVFEGALGQRLIDALLEPDAGKRRVAVEGWVHLAFNGLQGVLHEELSGYVRRMLDASYT